MKSNMKKVLITGADGYIGKNLINELKKNNQFEIITFSHKEKDIFDEYESTFKSFGSPDICIHLAWQDGFNHNAQSHINNLSKHFHFLKNLVNEGLKQLIVIGSMHEIGYYEGKVDENTPCNPLSYYGIAKNSLRQALQVLCNDHNEITFQWLRCFYIYGDFANGSSIFHKIYKMEQEGKKTFPFTSGINKYDFIDMNDLVKQIVAVASQTKIKGIINCCSGEAVSLKNKVNKFLLENNFSIKPEYGVFPNRPYDSPEIWGDKTKINIILNYEK